jgi:hypothetical protein
MQGNDPRTYGIALAILQEEVEHKRGSPSSSAKDRPDTSGAASQVLRPMCAG